ncbi:MAG: cupin domain-containing protein [Acidithiobacillus sp.]|uniref:cupin domain-containing protein n=1 Tax=Acidithiobacillus sp. TaxID=1872118 RepID=UPI0025BF3DCC|nr:cupin domain-containing protein [Acidithiobacillus sp.]
MKGMQWGSTSAHSAVEDPTALLASLGVVWERLPLPASSEVQALLARPTLDAAEQESLLRALDPVFQRLQRERGYRERDLVVLHPEHPDLEALDRRFGGIHRHDDEEVRYIVDGEGVFGFVLADGRQLELTVEGGDYLHVPAGVEHWFRLNGLRRIKAVRYFSARGGWTPVYVDTPQQDFPRP